MTDPSVRAYSRFPTLPLLMTLCLSSSALAETPVPYGAVMPQSGPKPTIGFSKENTSGQPAILEASELEYDQVRNTVTATGNVSIAQGESVVMADRMEYDQANNQVRAKGNVSMLEPSGNVYFADELELQDDLKAGAIQQFKARLTDNSVFVANRAKRLDEDRLALFKAAYTPCKCLTEDGQPKEPMWKLKARYALLDQETQKVYYDNVSMDIYGVPLLYAPYFSHAMPGADSKSGLLMPLFQHSSNLGNVYAQPIYYAIAPDRDLTLTPTYMSSVGPVLGGQYRQLFDTGYMTLEGSATSAPNHDSLGNRIPGREARGHVDGFGKFNVGDDAEWGFRIRRASDDTYLRLYNLSHDTLLTSKLYAQGFDFTAPGSRSFASAEALSFQGLTGQDDESVIPFIFPLAEVSWQSAPMAYHSRFLLSGNAMALYRGDGPESRRLSGTAGWKLPYISPDGQVIEFNAQMRTDIYNVSDVPLSNGDRFNGVTGRAVPQVSALWHYPLINRFSESSSLLVEPVVEVAASPGGGNPEEIPNEDSLLPEFTESNLFSDNRFAGYDRIENGLRMSYGLRGQLQAFSDKYIDWLIGQHYRDRNDPSFPFTNDLTSHFSDYVGKVGLTYDPFSLAYRFRLDKDELTANRSEVDVMYNRRPLALYASYLSLNNDPILSDKETVTGVASVALTDNWTWVVTGSRDLLLDEATGASTGLIFQNECVTLTSMVRKDYTTLQDIEPALSVSFMATFKNLD